MFIDEKGVGHGSEFGGIVGIDCRRKRHLEFIVIPFRWRNSFGIECQSHDGKMVAAVFFKRFLPHGQLETAESPTGPAIQDVLLAKIFGETNLLAIHVIKWNVGKCFTNLKATTFWEFCGFLGRRWHDRQEKRQCRAEKNDGFHGRFPMCG